MQNDEIGIIPTVESHRYSPSVPTSQSQSYKHFCIIKRCEVDTKKVPKISNPNTSTLDALISLKSDSQTRKLTENAGRDPRQDSTYSSRAPSSQEDESRCKKDFPPLYQRPAPPKTPPQSIQPRVPRRASGRPGRDAEGQNGGHGAENTLAKIAFAPSRESR
eukprot:302399-Amorphochlora_amoeboformis.AAC.1